MLEYKSGIRPLSPRTAFEARLWDIDTRIIMPASLGWKLYFREYRAVYRSPMDSLWVIQIGDTEGVDNITGQPMVWRGRRWMLSPFMSDGEIVRTVFLALMTAVEHELREQLLVDGVAVFDPHFDLPALVEAGRLKHNHAEDAEPRVSTAV